MSINYEKSARQFRAQKSALTRAVNKGDTLAILTATRKAVNEWNAPDGAWPDAWSRWQRAVDDALGWRYGVDIADLANQDDDTLRGLADDAAQWN